MFNSWIAESPRAVLAIMAALAVGCVTTDPEVEHYASATDALRVAVESPSEAARRNRLQVMASLDGESFGDADADGIAVHDHILLNVSPAMAEFDGRLYAAFKAGDGTQRLCVARSEDGATFGAQTCHDGLTMKNRPAMVAFDGRLYIAFRPADGSDQLCVTRSDDGVAFRPTPRCYAHVPLAAGPALAVFNDRLYVAANTGPQLAVTSSADGVTFDSPQVLEGLRLARSPAMAVFDGRLYISYRPNDGSDTLHVTRSDDGVAFRNPARHYANVQLEGDPSMTALDGKLHIAYRPRGQNDQLRVVSSADGVALEAARSYDTELLEFGPGLGAFNGRLYIPYKGPDAHLHILTTEDGPATGALANHPALIPHISSEVGPATAAFGNRLYVAFKADDGSNQLCIARTSTGATFSTPQCHPGLLLKNRPAIAAFQNRLYVAFRPADGSDRLCVTRSDDGVLFRATPRCYDNIPLSYGPALAAFEDRLYVAVNKGSTLAVASSSDGVWFGSPQVHGGIRLQGSPAMTAFEGRLYISFKANDSGNALYLTRSDNGVSFQTPAKRLDGIALSESPAMTAFEDKLYIAFRANDETGTLHVTSSNDGAHFNPPAQRYDVARVHHSPGMAAYAGRLYIPFMSRDDIELAWEYAPVWSFDDVHECYPLNLDVDPGTPNGCKNAYDPSFTVFASVERQHPGGETFRISYLVPYGKQNGSDAVGAHGEDVEAVVVDVVDGRFTSIRYSIHAGGYTKMAGRVNYHEGRPLVYVGATYHASYYNDDYYPFDVPDWVLSNPDNFGDFRGAAHRSVGLIKMIADVDPLATGSAFTKVAYEWQNSITKKKEYTRPYDLEACDPGATFYGIGSNICGPSDLGDTATPPGAWVTSRRESLAEFQLDGDAVGGAHGTRFNDIGQLWFNQVRGVQIYAGERVDALEVSYYAGSWTSIVRHGGNGGNNRGYINPTQDPIVEMEACKGQHDDNTRVFYLRLRTLSGNEIAGGSRTNDCHVWYGDADRQIAGFYGRSGNGLDMVGPIWELH